MIERLADAPVALQVVLVAALVARLTVLIVVDKAGTPVRSFLEARGPWGKYLANCPWCVGVWCSLVATGLWLGFPGWVTAAGTAAFAALVAGYVGAILKAHKVPPVE